MIGFDHRFARAARRVMSGRKKGAGPRVGQAQKNPTELMPGRAFACRFYAIGSAGFSFRSVQTMRPDTLLFDPLILYNREYAIERLTPQHVVGEAGHEGG